MAWLSRLRRDLGRWLLKDTLQEGKTIAPWRCQLETAHERREILLRRPGISKVEVGLVGGRIVLRVFDEHGTHLESVPMPKCAGLNCSS